MIADSRKGYNSMDGGSWVIYASGRGLDKDRLRSSHRRVLDHLPGSGYNK